MNERWVLNQESWNRIPDKGEGIILILSDALSISGDDALCVNIDGLLFWANLTEFEFVKEAGPHSSDEVKPGDVIRVNDPHWVEGPLPLRVWLEQGSYPK